MNVKPPTILTNLQRGNVKQENPVLPDHRTPHELAAQGELYSIDSFELDSVDSNNMTPLLWAAGYGQNQTVDLLLRLGSNPNHKSKSGKTALMFASSKGFLHVARTLIRGGANIDDVDENGSTALMYASYQDYSQVVEELLENNANLGFVNKFGQSAYSIALAKQSRLSQKAIETLLFMVAGHANRIKIAQAL